MYIIISCKQISTFVVQENQLSTDLTSLLYFPYYVVFARDINKRGLREKWELCCCFIAR